MVLEAEDYKVDKSANGDDAILSVKQGRYDIAFVDIQMPKMDGLELLRYLRGLRPKMPVVILTAYGTVHRAVEAMKLGAVDFLEKPFDPKAISFSARRFWSEKESGVATPSTIFSVLRALARHRKAFTEARVHLKIAMMRDLTRPEPYYELGSLAEEEDQVSHAVQYYYMALEAQSDFAPARGALTRLGRIRQMPTA